MRMTKVLTVVLLWAGLAGAQASRTWVSGVGDDVNPCSRTAPCKTFAGAISKTAAGGEIDALDPAGYGALTITKAITIDGGGGQVASVLVSGTNGIVVQAGPSDVVILRNLRFNGIGTGINGIRWLAGKSLFVERCYIFGFTNNGIDIEKSDGGRAYITDTTVENNGLSGLVSRNTVNNVQTTVDNSRFENNQFGIASEDFSRMSVRHSDTSGNSSVGLLSEAVTAGPALLDVYDSTSAHNNIGIQAGGSAVSSTANITGLALFDNAQGIVNNSGGTTNTFHNSFNTGTGLPNGISITPQ
jgi:Histidinol dehydrogenase